ncbi:MAG: hypothetical protein GY745_00250 [Actinomycetia bacterium]|nr:hypothetical protein [Actinomycetes bacterium]
MTNRDSRRYSGSRRSSNLFGALSFLAICVQIVAFASGGSVVVEQLSGPVTVPVQGSTVRDGGGAGPPEGLLVRIVEDLAGDGEIGSIDPEVATMRVDDDGGWHADLVAGRSYLAVMAVESLPSGAAVRPPTPLQVLDHDLALTVAGPAWFFGVEGPALALDLPTPPAGLSAGAAFDLVPEVHNEGRVALTGIEIDMGGVGCRVTDLEPGETGSCVGRIPIPMGSGIVTVAARALSTEGAVQAGGQVVLTGSGSPSLDLGVAVKGESDRPLTLTAGSALDRTVEVHNTGDLTLGPVEVSDAQAGVVCILGRLEVGQGRSCRIVRDARSGSHLVDVSVQAGVLGPDGTPILDPIGQPFGPLTAATSFSYTGTGTEVVRVERPTTDGPGLSLDYQVGGHRPGDTTTRELLVGDESDRTYVVHNTGNTGLANLVVSDDGIGLVCTIPRLPVGAAQACTLPVDVVQAGIHTSNAIVSATGVDDGGVPLIDDVVGLPQARVVARDSVTVRGLEPELHAAVTATPQPVVKGEVGAPHPAEVVITNRGETMVVDLAAQIGVKGANSVDLMCDEGSVGPGQEVRCRADLILPPGHADLQISAEGIVQATDGERLGSVVTSDAGAVRVPVAALSSHPELLGADGNGRLVVGVEVANAGPDPATDLVLDLGTPTGALLGGSGPGWHCADAGCVVGRLAAGESSAVRLVLNTDISTLVVSPRLDSSAVDALDQERVLTIDVERARARANAHDSWAPWLGSSGLTLAAYAAMAAGLLVWWRLALIRRLGRAATPELPVLA